ncbi:MAG: cupin domain-containing protein [Daejeonella sp.]|uniref:cupin domain-containing protein n=1 Tax=Daejeonella sp. TaxID=2805397 RepID=UPI003C7781C8
MKKLLSLVLMINLFVVYHSQAQQKPIFPKGEKSPNVNHVGDVWLTELSHADSVFTYSTSVAVSDPGARLNWHIHPGGQILIVTEGTGYYQEKGKDKRIIKTGDVIKCLPGVEHWHGATPKTGVTYIATSPTEKGKTIWLHKVTDAEYFGTK